VSARIDENGVKMKKLGLKQGSRGLFVIVLNLKRALPEEIGG
jgi:hypothetical protein